MKRTRPRDLRVLGIAFLAIILFGIKLSPDWTPSMADDRLAFLSLSGRELTEGSLEFVEATPLLLLAFLDPYQSRSPRFILSTSPFASTQI